MLRIREIPLPAWEGTAIATTGALTSAAIDMQKYIGNAVSIHIVATGTAVDLDGTFTVGENKDATAFVTAEDTLGNSINAICDAVGAAGTSADAWVQFSPVLAPYMKVVITGGAANNATTISRARLYIQEDV